MNPVEQLAETELAPERYHPDGYGHLQVEPVIYGFGESPKELLELIDQQQRWPEFTQLACQRPSAWRIELLRHLPDSSSYNAGILSAFIEEEEDADTRLFLLEQIPLRLWNQQTAALLPPLISLARQRLDECRTVCADDEMAQISDELEQQMLSELVEQLQARLSALCPLASP